MMLSDVKTQNSEKKFGPKLPSLPSKSNGNSEKLKISQGEDTKFGPALPNSKYGPTMPTSSTMMDSNKSTEKADPKLSTISKDEHPQPFGPPLPTISNANLYGPALPSSINSSVRPIFPIQTASNASSLKPNNTYGPALPNLWNNLQKFGPSIPNEAKDDSSANKSKLEPDQRTQPAIIWGSNEKKSYGPDLPPAFNEKPDPAVQNTEKPKTDTSTTFCVPIKSSFPPVPPECHTSIERVLLLYNLDPDPPLDKETNLQQAFGGSCRGYESYSDDDESNERRHSTKRKKNSDDYANKSSHDASHLDIGGFRLPNFKTFPSDAISAAIKGKFSQTDKEKHFPSKSDHRDDHHDSSHSRSHSGRISHRSDHERSHHERSHREHSYREPHHHNDSNFNSPSINSSIRPGIHSNTGPIMGPPLPPNLGPPLPPNMGPPLPPNIGPPLPPNMGPPLPANLAAPQQGNNIPLSGYISNTNDRPNMHGPPMASIMNMNIRSNMNVPPGPNINLPGGQNNPPGPNMNVPNRASMNVSFGSNIDIHHGSNNIPNNVRNMNMPCGPGMTGPQRPNNMYHGPNNMPHGNSMNMSFGPNMNMSNRPNMNMQPGPRQRMHFNQGPNMMNNRPGFDMPPRMMGQGQPMFNRPMGPGNFQNMQRFDGSGVPRYR